jgi:predicted negative regulator of RcsB-dependent stress response
MARRISRKELKRDEVAEAAGEARDWLEEHVSDVLRWGGLIVTVVIVVLGWRAWSHHSESVARELLAGGIAAYDNAVSGGTGFEDVLATFDEAQEKAGNRPVGQLARFYRGATLFQMGRLDEAATALEEVAGSTEISPTLAATAQSMLARVYVAAGRHEDAVALLNDAVESDTPGFPQDQALLELGRLHASVGRDDLARESWQRLLDEYPASAAASEARRLLGS